jgi:hypothetical protein
MEQAATKMDYFILWVVQTGDEEFCYVDDEPKGMSTWKLFRGEEILPKDMPTDKPCDRKNRSPR